MVQLVVARSPRKQANPDTMTGSTQMGLVCSVTFPRTPAITAAPAMPRARTIACLVPDAELVWRAARRSAELGGGRVLMAATSTCGARENIPR